MGSFALPRRRPVSEGLPVDAIRRALLEWYAAHRRDLPWRKTRDPYRIWLSEVMLQQTRVETVLRYYDRFLERFPTLRDLAAAPEEDVLKAWEGLGYYRRARQLHAAARRVVAEYGGVVPDDPVRFGALPGVGKYTLGAVMSIAFGRPLPAVDGNVQRVLSRLIACSEAVDRGAGQQRIEALAARLVPSSGAGTWTQALMELGALVCTPRAPTCTSCPLAEWCAAREDGAPEAFPVKGERPSMREVDRAVSVVIRDGRVLLRRRPEDGLLGGLWEFPAVESERGRWSLPGQREAALAEYLEALGLHGARVRQHLGDTTHTFSHVRWRMSVYYCEAETIETGEALMWAGPAEFESLARARAVERIASLARAASLFP